MRRHSACHVPRIFTKKNGFGRDFFADSGNWYSYKLQAENSFSGIYQLVQMSAIQTAQMRPERTKQCSLSAVMYDLFLLRNKMIQKRAFLFFYIFCIDPKMRGHDAILLFVTMLLILLFCYVLRFFSAS